MRKLLLLTPLFLLCALWSQAQNREVTGKITDSTGAPLAGASIYLKGAHRGTSATPEGIFKIMAPASGRLIVSAIGYEPKEIPLGSSNELPVITLMSSLKTLNEVVVTALGIRREKRELGTATQTINADQINRSGTGNPLSELEGKAAGLTVINSTGDPGGGTYFRLRGVTSITGNNQPLMVVDGVPIDNSVNNFDPTNAGFQASGANANLTGGAQPTNRGIDLNPNDIESINVLKGPAATALYGLQAGSGAIVITTKKGSARKGVGVTFNSSVGMDKVSQLPALQHNYAQGNRGRYAGPETGTSISWGPAIDTLSWDGATDYPWDKHGHIVGNSDPSAKTKVTPYDEYRFFGTGLTFNNNIALSGGGEGATYRLSLGNLSQTGIIPKSKYIKTTISMNGQARLSDRLTVSGGVTYINSENHKVQQGSSLSAIMLGLSRTTPTFDNSNGYSNAADHPESYVLPDGIQRNYRGGGGYDNPYWTVNRNPFISQLDRVIGYGQAAYRLLDWMDLGYRVGGDVYTQGDKDAYDINSGQAPTGAIYLIDFVDRQFNSDFTMNMHKSFTDDLSGSLLVGHNYFVSSQNNRFASGTAFVVPEFFDISNATSFLSTETQQRKRTMAFYAEAQLNYKKMYYLTLTGRREVSSTLPKANNTFFYPSASLSWVFSELEGLKNSSLFSFGKLRASVAQVGKDAPIYGLKTPFVPGFFKDGFTTGITFPVNGVGGYQISSAIATLGNSDLKPENTYSYEFGADLSFLKNRVTLNATVYYSKSRDVIFPTSIPFSTGYGAKLLNAATISNKGLELTLNTSPVKTGQGLNWDLNFNWSRNLNKVEALTPGITRFFVAGFGGGEAEVDAVVGQPYGMLYGNTYIHVTPGDVKSAVVIDDNPADMGSGYGQPLTGGPNAVVGNTNPDWIGSVISNLSYKGFSFGFQVDVRHGGDLYNGTRGALANKGTAAETGNRGTPTIFKGILGHLDANGDLAHFNGSAEKPGPGSNNAIKSSFDQFYWQNIGSSFGVGPQEFDVENGGFTRIRQISLSYELSRECLRKAHLSSLSLTVYANNPKIWTKYDGVDPETSLAGPSNAQGLDYFNGPGTKSYGIRLTLGL